MSQVNKAVDPGNPCPFLRALAAGNYIHPDIESIHRVAAIVGEAAGGGPARKVKFRVLTQGIALIANGLGLKDIARNMREGLHVAELRDGPLYKKGVGSRILSQTGEFNEQEFQRLKEFARTFATPSGSELGLSIKELHTMMDENFARAPHRRPQDRKLMNGEWPVLLDLMKKGEGEDAYLSLDELRTLFADRKLPQRIIDRIAAFQRSASR